MRLPNASALCKYEGMRLLLRCLLILLAGLAFTHDGRAQTTRGQSSPAGSSKRFCQTDGGFCFTYPANWLVLGEAFGDGVIVAPQQKTERALWDEVTVATVVAAPAENQTGPSIDDIIGTAIANMQADGRSPQTQQRQQRTVDGLAAQMIRLQYHDDEGRDWIEELVFIAGPAQEIYSVALKAQPATIARIEPAFASVLRSWKLQSPSGAAAAAPATSPANAPASASTPPKN